MVESHNDRKQWNILKWSKKIMVESHNDRKQWNILKWSKYFNFQISFNES